MVERGKRNKMNKQFKELKEENEKIRNELDKLIGINNPIYSPIWVSINDLIENESQQEKYCNQ